MDYGHAEPPWSVVDNDRDEARAAARHDRFGMRRVGDRMWEDHEVPDPRDVSDEWGES